MRLRLLAAVAAAALSLAACGGSDGKPASGKSRRQAGGPAGPPVGVYSYETSGFERVSAVFASRHGYPRASTVTVSQTPCGFNERWVPRPERSSESHFCLKGRRWRLDTLVDYHEFFGQAVRQRFACEGPLVPRPPTVPIGFRWTDRCRGAGSRVTVHYEAVREQPIAVAGKPVKTVFVRAEAQLRGRIEGVNRLDSWLSRENGLLVRRRVRSATAIDSPFGKIRDRERYALDLRSASPR
jgi:hypothetical protein